MGVQQFKNEREVLRYLTGRINGLQIVMSEVIKILSPGAIEQILMGIDQSSKEETMKWASDTSPNEAEANAVRAGYDPQMETIKNLIHSW